MTTAQAEAMSHDERVARIEKVAGDDPVAVPLLAPAPASQNIVTIGDDHYFYDTAGRLVSRTIEGSTNEQDYGYDTFGNRTSASRKAGAAPCVAGGSTIDCEETVTTNSLTNRITSNGATYDSAGNLKTFDSWTYTWDAVSMMTRQSGTGVDREFVYTPDDERIGLYQVTGGTWTWTVRGLDKNVVREFQGLTWNRDYVWRTGGILAAINAQNTSAVVQNYHLDHVGTPRLVTDGGGNKLGLHSYYAFGGELSLSPTENPFLKLKFTGYDRDITGDVATLDYTHARYYHANTGRFLSADPMLGTSSAPQTWNCVTFVSNSPIVYVDPDGQSLESVWETVRGWFSDQITVHEYTDDYLQRMLLMWLLQKNFTAAGPGGSFGERYLGTIRRFAHGDIDYMSVNVSLGVPFTKGLGGAGGVVSIDKYGRIYYNKLWHKMPIPSASAGKSFIGVSGAVTFGALLQSQSASPSQLQDFLTGNSFNYGYGALVGSGFSYSPNTAPDESSLAAEVGVYTPQMGVTYSNMGGPWP